MTALSTEDVMIRLKEKVTIYSYCSHVRMSKALSTSVMEEQWEDTLKKRKRWSKFGDASTGITGKKM